jgi:hypothetical protein
MIMHPHIKIIIGVAVLIELAGWAPSQVAMAEPGPGSETTAAVQTPTGTGLPLEFKFTATGGYRVDDLDWNIAGDTSGNNPNILSELTWDDIESYQVKLEGRMVWPRRIALRGSLAYGWIFDGDNQDSDYLGNHRSFEFSRSNNSTDDDDVWDASVAVGYPLRFGKTVIGTVTPLVGYSHHEQELNITDGRQTIPNLGPFPGLDSTYDIEWEGPWIGIDLHFQAAELKSFAHRFETYVTYEYHWTDYDAEGNWNLRGDLDHPKSFNHDTDCEGFIIKAGFDFRFNQHWALNVNFDYLDWSTDEGTSKIFFADGSNAKTRLNEVNWTSWSWMAGLSLRF